APECRELATWRAGCRPLLIVRRSEQRVGGATLTISRPPLAPGRPPVSTSFTLPSDLILRQWTDLTGASWDVRYDGDRVREVRRRSGLDMVAAATLNPCRDPASPNFGRVLVQYPHHAREAFAFGGTPADVVGRMTPTYEITRFAYERRADGTSTGRV